MTNCCKSSAACPLACYHGAHSSFMELPSVLSSNIIICRPLDGRQTAANRLQHALLLITIAELCPLGLICLLWSSLFSLWSNVILRRPFDGCQTTANRPQHRLLYFSTADLCPMGLICLSWSSLLFLLFQNIVCRPLNVCPTAANRLQHALLLITIAELCPLGLTCLLMELPFGSLCIKSHHVSIHSCVSNCC